VYRWYEEVEDDLALFVRDADVAVGQREASTRLVERMRRVADALADGLAPGKAVRAAVGHALEFETWRSLVRRQGLSRRQAVEAMLALVDSV
jgi:hypothetical protein